MTTYRLFIAGSADRVFRKLPRRMRETIWDELAPLKLNPFLGERLSGPLDFLYSYHFAVFGKDFRAAYTINTATGKLTIYYIGPRGGFYERLKRLFK